MSLWREENQKDPEKNSWSVDENQLHVQIIQTQPTVMPQELNLGHSGGREALSPMLVNEKLCYFEAWLCWFVHFFSSRNTFNGCRCSIKETY